MSRKNKHRDNLYDDEDGDGDDDGHGYGQGQGEGEGEVEKLVGNITYVDGSDDKTGWQSVQKCFLCYFRFVCLSHFVVVIVGCVLPFSLSNRL